MPETTKRNIRLLGVGWLGFGVLLFALAFIAFLSVVLGDDPATQAFESGDKWWIVVTALLVLGAVPIASGLLLLRRHPAARRLIAITSIVLLVPSIGALVPLLVVAPSLWLTLTGDGKKILESYMARETG